MTSEPLPIDASLDRDTAIARLVEAEGGRLYSLGLRFCGDPEEARDLVQETFLQAWRGWEGFEGRAKPSTWLYTIAARVCQRFHKKRAGEPDRMRSLDDEMPLSDPALAVVPEEVPEELRQDVRDRVEEEIAALPLDFRMPLVLKEIVGLPVADVARAMEIPEATVKTRLHRARLKVRKAVDEALPKREVPPPAFSRQVCLDMLKAKQDTLDRGVEFEFPKGALCERCSEFFATLDLTHDVCSELGKGGLPPEVRAAVEASLQGA